MKSISSNLDFLVELRLSLARGDSFKSFMIFYCKEHTNSLAKQLSALLLSYQQNKPIYEFVSNNSPERELVLDLVWRALNGEPVLKHFSSLEDELICRAHTELDEKIKKLPIKVLLIVVFFHFPALLILALLPLLHEFIGALK